MSPSEREAYLANERARSSRRFTDPKKRAAQAASKRRTAQRKIANGICVACLNLATCGDRYCFDHWLLSVGHKYGLTIRNGGVEIIKATWNEQAGMCALTGEKLVPGQNASLDHATPRCRGGTNDKINLQWVTKEVNLFKKTRTNGEFVRMCVRIAHHAERDASNVLPFVKPSIAAEV